MKKVFGRHTDADGLGIVLPLSVSGQSYCRKNFRGSSARYSNAYTATTTHATEIDALIAAATVAGLLLVLPAGILHPRTRITARASIGGIVM